MESIHGVDVSWLHHSPKGTQSSFSLISAECWKLRGCGAGRYRPLHSDTSLLRTLTTVYRPLFKEYLGLESRCRWERFPKQAGSFTRQRRVDCAQNQWNFPYAITWSCTSSSYNSPCEFRESRARFQLSQESERSQSNPNEQAEFVDVKPKLEVHLQFNSTCHQHRFAITSCLKVPTQ